MDFAAFVTGYRSGSIRAHVDPEQATRVCSHSPALPRRYRASHLILKNTSTLLFVGGVIGLLWIPWWAGLAAIILGLAIAPTAQRSAARFVLDYALEDESFFRQMLESGVLEVEQARP